MSSILHSTVDGRFQNMKFTEVSYCRKYVNEASYLRLVGVYICVCVCVCKERKWAELQKLTR
jgi:hypothetical protein